MCALNELNGKRKIWGYLVRKSHLPIHFKELSDCSSVIGILFIYALILFSKPPLTLKVGYLHFKFHILRLQFYVDKIALCLIISMTESFENAVQRGKKRISDMRELCGQMKTLQKYLASFLAGQINTDYFWKCIGVVDGASLTVQAPISA